MNSCLKYLVMGEIRIYFTYTEQFVGCLKKAAGVGLSHTMRGVA